MGGDTNGRWKDESADAVADPAAELAKAVELRAAADVAIVFVGHHRRRRTGGRDRKTLGLTGAQEALVEAVFAANPRTVVVEMSAGPLTVPWIAKKFPRCCKPGGRAKKAATRLPMFCSAT